MFGAFADLTAEAQVRSAIQAALVAWALGDGNIGTRRGK